MELRDYIALRRGYSLVRRGYPSQERLTFEEFAVLCRLYAGKTGMKTSDIADYQGSLRPTMTHRTNRLVELGLIERAFGQKDRRNVYCSLTEEGIGLTESVCEAMRRQVIAESPSRRLTADRVCRMVEAMGTHAFHAGDLMLVGLMNSPDETSTISGLVKLLGLLQPTVSMSIATLEKRGLVVRERAEGDTRSVRIMMTEAGRARAQELAALISKMSVARNRIGDIRRAG